MVAIYYPPLYALIVLVMVTQSNYLPGISARFFTNTLDLSMRTDPNDMALFSLYALWTAAWSLSILVLIVYVSRISRGAGFEGLVVQFLRTVIVLLSVIKLWEPMLLSATRGLTSAWGRYEEWSVLLLNPVNRVHPALLYFTTAGLWYVISLASTPTSVNRFSGNTSTSHKHNALGRNLWILILTLGLGGYWAAQEGSWGSWWNWDASEELGLLLALTYLSTIHVIYSKRWEYAGIHNEAYKVSILGITSLVLGCIFELTNHNFDLVSVPGRGGSKWVVFMGTLYVLTLRSNSNLLRVSSYRFTTHSPRWRAFSLRQITHTVSLVGIGGTFVMTVSPVFLVDPNVFWLHFFRLGGGETPQPSLAASVLRIYFLPCSTSLLVVSGMGLVCGWGLSPTLIYSSLGLGWVYVIHTLPIVVTANIMCTYSTQSYCWRALKVTKTLHQVEPSTLLSRRRSVVTPGSYLGGRSNTFLVNYQGYDQAQNYFVGASRARLVNRFLHSSRGRGSTHSLLGGERQSVYFLTLACEDYCVVSAAGLAALIAIGGVYCKRRPFLY
jgi:hypothetical protein